MPLYVVFGKAPSIEELKNVTPEQAARFLELHPHVHIFEGEEIAP